MMSEYLHTTLQLALLCGLWWLFAFGYCRYRLDLLRQKLFSIRDNLFREACDRELLNSFAYTLTRTTLNGMIRFAHEVSFSHFLILYFARHRLGAERSGAAYIKRLMDALDPMKLEDKKLILSAHGQAHLAILDHVVRTSVILAPIAFITLIVLHAIRQFSRVTSLLTNTKVSRKKWAILDAEANEVGQDLQIA